MCRKPSANTTIEGWEIMTPADTRIGAMVADTSTEAMTVADTSTGAMGMIATAMCMVGIIIDLMATLNKFIYRVLASVSFFHPLFFIPKRIATR